MIKNARMMLRKYSYIVFVFILACAYLFSLTIAPVNADYGYYVGAAKSIAHGLVPYRDVSLGYPPFVFYLLSIPYVLCGMEISPLVPMYIAFFFNLASGCLIWQILKKLEVNKITRQYTIILYIIYLYSVESVFLGLEPFATFWGLLGTYILLRNKKHLGIAGLCLTLAFLCKQYALLYAPVYVLLILLLRLDQTIKERLLAVFQVALWSFISVLIVHLFFVYFTGQGDYYTLLLGTGYGRRSFLGVIDVLQKRFFHMFFIVLLIPIIWRKANQWDRRRMIFLVFSIFFLLLQNYYDTSPHYLIFIVPYIVILNAIVIRNISSTWFRISFYWIVLLFAVLFFKRATEDYQIVRKNENNLRELTRNQQLDVVGFLQEVIPPKSKTVVARQWNYLVTPHLYGLVNIAPVNYRNTRFGFEDDSQLIEQVKDANVLIIETSHPLYDEYLNQIKSPCQSYSYKNVRVFLYP
ncbi:ArnT family glycosyltransferase [Bacteroides reticulotermitis]|uniref:Glycosyltransferase RgtA/B/C/D-like domain-containing protein n=2 Tax=Bacteroides reticulotermitis TaxID=1133319 RepID=W4UP75_9BACE|nr:hypothetical protein [Bacteroides reticulotermitis]MBB4044032.1 hypothetical protein [Bacteroides reticulotermitis]GAE82627.1 hypothetical protein JCM10512_847 [Bacteroides reticulotermitis JCM 10512]